MEAKSSGRVAAYARVKQCVYGTVGFLIRKIMERPYMKPFVSSEIAAGDIGSFYAENYFLLESEWTDANIERFCEKETDFFQKQTGLTRFVGGLLSAEQRAELLKEERKKHK